MVSAGRLVTRRVPELAAIFSRLGWMSFGGPIAHIGYLRAEFVQRRKWLDDAQYADLVALCQFLPGPASSQVVFAIGMQRAGLLGALTASACFTLPSALLMIAFGYGMTLITDFSTAGWLHGLKLAAVAVVAQAVWGMGRRLCPDSPRASLCMFTAAVLMALPGAGVQLGLIALGAVIGLWLYRDVHRDAALGGERVPGSTGEGSLFGAAALGLFASIFGLLPLLAAMTASREVSMFDSFYRSGALVFGGGHVVLPLLRLELVPRGWLTDDQFLAGYAAAQALPGPMFAFAAYLGTVMTSGALRWLYGFMCLFAIFLPAWLLIGGALPFWQRLRTKPRVQAALAGANAAVVGVLLAALYSPIFTDSVKSTQDAVAALVAFCLLEHWNTPPWLVVLGMALTGQCFVFLRLLG